MGVQAAKRIDFHYTVVELSSFLSNLALPKAVKYLETDH